MGSTVKLPGIALEDAIIIRLLGESEPRESMLPDKPRSKLKNNLQESFKGFSFILFVVFTRSIFRMLYQIYSWLVSHRILDIMILAAYTFAFALFESGIVFIFILLVGILMPRRIFLDFLIPQVCVATILLSIWALIFQFSKSYWVDLELELLILLTILVVFSWIIVWILLRMGI